MKVKEKIHSKIPSFWEGFASIFGYSQPIEDNVSDWDALRGDWQE